MYSFLNASRAQLNLEFVWTIDGKIKYKFFMTLTVMKFEIIHIITV